MGYKGRKFETFVKFVVLCSTCGRLVQDLMQNFETFVDSGIRRAFRARLLSLLENMFETFAQNRILRAKNSKQSSPKKSQKYKIRNIRQKSHQNWPKFETFVKFMKIQDFEAIRKQTAAKKCKNRSKTDPKLKFSVFLTKGAVLSSFFIGDCYNSAAAHKVNCNLLVTKVFCRLPSLVTCSSG